MHVTERLRADRHYCSYCPERAVFWTNRVFGRTVFSDEQCSREPSFGIHSVFGFAVFFDTRRVEAHAARRAWCVACICWKRTVKRLAFAVDPELIVTAGRTDWATVSTTLGAVIISIEDGWTVHETTWFFGNRDFLNRTP